MLMYGVIAAVVVVAIAVYFLVVKK